MIDRDPPRSSPDSGGFRATPTGKPIVDGHRLAVEHVRGMLAAGDDMATILEGYPWMEREDVLACVEYARRLVAHERVAPRIAPSAA